MMRHVQTHSDCPKEGERRHPLTVLPETRTRSYRVASPASHASFASSRSRGRNFRCKPERLNPSRTDDHYPHPLRCTEYVHNNEHRRAF
jgi:hypothetical protein